MTTEQDKSIKIKFADGREAEIIKVENLDTDKFIKELTKTNLNLKAELEEKDKIIDESIKIICAYNAIYGCHLGQKGLIENCIGMTNCEKCLKQYFERKVEE